MISTEERTAELGLGVGWRDEGKPLMINKEPKGWHLLFHLLF